ncbi:MAG: DegV family protein [Bacilli bacterium]|nr:DegV family protein [Bacilli bacterium]
MERKIAILTDSSSSLYHFKHDFDNIFLIDIPCFIGDVMFSNFEKNKDDLFFDALANTTMIAKTSQPSVGETLEKFEEIKAKGFTDIIYIPISKELSGTYQNGFISKGMVDDINVEIIDTKTTASILSGMAMEAAKLAKEGKTVEEIIQTVLELRERTGYFVTVNDLTSLVKNGRLSNAKSVIANLLKIKPVIELTAEGKLVSLENVRTYKNAIKRMVEHVSKKVDPVNGELHIAHTNIEDTLEFLTDLLKEKFPNTKVVSYPVPSTIAAHIGLNAIALGYINYK